LRFELCKFHSCRHAHLCSSGTAAVELALRALGVSPGDEVVMAAYDFKANFTNIHILGAMPVLVDLRADDWQLDVIQLEAALSDKTKAIIVTHLHGGMVDLERVRAICRPRSVPIIEDICQLEGATIQGILAGKGGDLGVMSFGGSKLLTAGRGGAIITDNDEYQQRIKLYTERGNDVSPLSEMQAAVLLPQLEKLTERTQIRAAAATRLFEALALSKGLRPIRSQLNDSFPGYYKVGIQYEPREFGGLPRDRFSEAMIAEGFALHSGFRSLHSIHSRKRYQTSGELSEADRADENILVLHHPILLEASEWPQEFVRAVDKIRSFSDDLKSCEG
jgi:dTDP-4-amino-4,6-dideoxygalactose transaminase